MYLILAAELYSVKSHPDGSGFEGRKRPWERANAWHCVEELEALKKAISKRLLVKRLSVKVQPSCSRRFQYF